MSDKTEYIEREAIDVNGCRCVTVGGSLYLLIDDVFEKIDSVPASDVEPVVHADWKWRLRRIDSVNAIQELYCTNCKKTPEAHRSDIIDFRRCPSCGAHMGEGSKGK